MNMKSREPISFSEHQSMGLILKRADRALLDVLTCSNRLYSHEVRRVLKGIRSLDEIRSRLDGEMFRDYPEISTKEGNSVYYGVLSEGGIRETYNDAGNRRR